VHHLTGAVRKGSLAAADIDRGGVIDPSAGRIGLASS